MDKTSQHILFQSNEANQSFSNFYGKGNQLLKEKLMSFLQSKDSLVAYIYGEAGMGKTHLLKSCCHYSVNKFATESCHIYLNYRELNDDLLEYVRETIRDYTDKYNGSKYSEINIIVVIDDLIDNIVAQEKGTDEKEPKHKKNAKAAQAEVALLSIYELLKKIKDANNGIVKLICSSLKPPNRLAFQHKDLQTRLATAIIYPIIYADDIEKQEIVQAIAKNIGAILKPDILDYIFNHYSRHLPNLIKLLNELDVLSLQQQRKITIPLVKQAISNIDN